MLPLADHFRRNAELVRNPLQLPRAAGLAPHFESFSLKRTAFRRHYIHPTSDRLSCFHDETLSGFHRSESINEKTEENPRPFFHYLVIWLIII
jgi:hypothetical protein